MIRVIRKPQSSEEQTNQLPLAPLALDLKQFPLLSISAQQPVLHAWPDRLVDPIHAIVLESSRTPREDIPLSLNDLSGCVIEATLLSNLVVLEIAPSFVRLAELLSQTGQLDVMDSLSSLTALVTHRARKDCCSCGLSIQSVDQALAHIASSSDRVSVGQLNEALASVCTSLQQRLKVRSATSAKPVADRRQASESKEETRPRKEVKSTRSLYVPPPKRASKQS